MITGPRSQFEQRLAQRGYTLDEVRACIVSDDGDTITVDETHAAYPREPKPGFVPPKPPEVYGPHRPAPKRPEPTPEASLARDDDTPGWLGKIKNFAVASAKHVAAGAPMASDEEIVRRHDICLGCEFLKNDACSKCGCPVVRQKQYVSKLSWADSKCPVGKW